MHLCDWSKSSHVLYSKPSYSLGNIITALNNIALQIGPVSALSNIVLCDSAHNDIATPTTVSLIFLNNS